MADNLSDPYDINGQHFNSNMYLQKLFKECTLKQITDHEAEIKKNVETLNSDRQTLVYENYNKFISATDTIRKMKTDFKEMEDSMDMLAKNMDSITSFSDQISSTLQGTRQQIAKLSSVHALLKKLQFLFKLPANLKDRMNEENYSQAVEDYIYAQRVLDQYGNMPSFQGIRKDCEDILEELKSRLRTQFHKRDASTKSVADNVDLLLQLKEPADTLCAEFLMHAEGRLTEQLESLKNMCENDIIEFVDMASSGFLSDLCLIVSSYNNMFMNRSCIDDNELADDFDTKALVRLNNFIMKNMKNYFDLVGKRVENVADTAILVRALDKFHTRLQAMNMLCKEIDFARIGIDIVMSAGRKQCRNHLHNLKQHLSEALVKVRQILATKVPNPQEGDGGLAELQALLTMPVIEKVKGVLQDLRVFLQPDLSFSLKTQFLQSFCVDEVREGLVVGFLHHLTVTASGFCTGYDTPKFPPTLLLLLSKMCIEYKENNARYLLTTTDDLFNIDQFASSASLITPYTEIAEKFQEAAQNLLNHYVRIQGLAVSQMLRKSVETRDWLRSIEPRTVRNVMKRVVEDVTAIDVQVGALYDDCDGQADRSSGSSRKTHRRNYRSSWSSYTPSHIDSSLVTNIQKIFSERIEIFSSVQFNKASILTGIIKISLKTLLECVRLRTFSKYGLQQIQVDIHYLKLYLWRFVSDENVVHCLLDEIFGSAVHRCLEPVSMEQSVVDIICERGYTLN